MGRTAAAALTTLAIDMFRPQAVFFKVAFEVIEERARGLPTARNRRRLANGTS